MFKGLAVLTDQHNKTNAWPSGWIVLLALLLGLLTNPADAGMKTYGTVTVNLDPPAQAESYYGYAVYRLSVINRGKTAREVTVVLPADSWSNEDSIGRLSRTVRVEPGATAVAELLQPPLPINGEDARVFIDGQAQRDQLRVAIADHMSYYGSGEPILISHGVVGPVIASYDKTRASATEEEWDEFSGTYVDYGDQYDMVRPSRPVSEWSGNWLAYSRYLMVMVRADELQSAPPSVDAALRDYVAAGGTVLLLGQGEVVPDPSALWQEGSLSHWKAPDGRSAEMRLGLGKLHLYASNKLARFDSNAWQQFLSQVSRENRPRRTRFDASESESRLPMIESLQVPTRGLLALMLLFTLLIGPGNILLLNWLKRRMWLLWTIPAIAFVFASAVLLYSIFNEGIEPRAKTVSITMLDQRTRQSVTVGLTGYYAPLTPGDGMHFSDRTQITPQTGDYEYYDYGYSGRSRSMDVTNGQHLTRGWIVARVPAHLELRNVESRRERLEITRTDAGGLSVVNGLGLPIQRLLIADEQGRFYEVNSLSAGGSATALSMQWSGETNEHAMDIFKQYGVLDAARRIQAEPEASLDKSMYIALLDNASFSEPGLAGLTKHETTGIVIGRWEETK
ncbi:MAG: hypothetical protein AAGI37_02760 [Planctomycetota bacterium]